MKNFADSILAFKKSLEKEVYLLPEEKEAKPKIIWTEEQEKFLNCNDKSIVLEALAGSGKTSCLIEYARRRPSEKWNLIVFNKNIADEILKTAPKNLKVITGHGLAYSIEGVALKNKITDNEDDVDKFLLSLNINKKIIVEFNLWLTSPYKTILEFCKNINSLNKEILEKIWADSINASNEMPITHDVYLKLFCMRNDYFSGRWMLDEAQDWSDSWWSLWDGSDFRKIVAGDPYQSLYQWRGGRGYIGSARHFLTKSIRTPNSIEPSVNKLLLQLGCKNRWVGNDNNAVTSNDKEDEFKIKEFNPDVIIGSSWNDLNEIKNRLNKIGLKTRNSIDGDGILLTTAFKVKGMSFKSVWVTDKCGEEHNGDKLEYMIAYVALTRHENKIRLPIKWVQKNTDINAGDDIF